MMTAFRFGRLDSLVSLPASPGSGVSGASGYLSLVSGFGSSAVKVSYLTL